MMKNRVVRVPVSEELVALIIRNGGYAGAGKYTVTGGVPETAEYRGATYDPVCRCVFMFFEDDSFEEVEEGMDIPCIYPMYHLIFDEEDGDGD